MKKLLLSLMLLATLKACALDFNYSTNLFWWVSSPTNIYAGTSGSDPGRDTYIQIWNKINANFTLLWTHPSPAVSQQLTNWLNLLPNNGTNLYDKTHSLGSFGQSPVADGTANGWTWSNINYTNVTFVPDCIVSFGEGAGGEANFTMGSSSDQDDGRVYFSALSNFQITDPGGFWTGDSSGGGDTDYYTAPVSGYYLLNSWIRVTDGTAPDSDGIGGAQPGELEIGSHDYPGFQWFVPNSTRCAWQNIRILHLNGGDHVSCVTGSDNGDTASDGNFAIHLLSVP